MLQKWLEMDTNASWQEIFTAVGKCTEQCNDEGNLAKAIPNQTLVSRPPPACSELIAIFWRSTITWNGLGLDSGLDWNVLSPYTRCRFK